MDICPEVCREILEHYVQKHQEVAQEMIARQQGKPLQMQDIMAHKHLVELVDLCHEVYHIAIELAHGGEDGSGTHEVAHDMHARQNPGYPMRVGVHTGPAPGLQSIVGKPHA